MSDAVERLRTATTGTFYGLHLVPLPLEEGPGRQGAHRPKGSKMGKLHDVAELHRDRIIKTTEIFNPEDINYQVKWSRAEGYQDIGEDEVQVGDETLAWSKNALRASLVVKVGRKNFTVASSSPSAINDSVRFGYPGGALITLKVVPKDHAGPHRRPKN